MTQDLLVVGGGWAGCSAALRAAHRGLRVTLLEGAPRLGGRASSFEDSSGERLDNGQHLFLGAYTETLELLETLGTASQIDFRVPLRVPYLMDDGRLEVLQASSLPGPLSLGAGLLKFGPLRAPLRSLLSLGLRGGMELAAAGAGWLPESSAGKSVAGWLQDCGQDRAALSVLWEPMVLAALNARPERARLREFLAVLGGGFLRGGFSAALGRARVPLSGLLEPLPALLQAQGSRVRMGCAVVRVEASGRAWKAHLADGGVLESPRLILAVPPRRAAALLGEAVAGPLGLAAEAGRPVSAIVSVWIWSSAPLLPEPMLAFGPQGADQPRFHWGFSRPVEGGWRSCVVSSAAAELAAMDAHGILAALAAFLASRGRHTAWERARVVKEKSATPVFEPGSPARLGQATPLGGLALAGDWTETRLPATIEGAVRSGRLAFETLSFGERPDHD